MLRVLKYLELFYRYFQKADWFLKNKFWMTLYKIRYDSFPKISGTVIWKCPGSVIIGKNLTITSRFSSNPIGGQSKTCFLVSREGKLIIHNNVSISNATIASMNKVEIEDCVMIGGGVQIFDTNFHSLKLEYRLTVPDKDIKTAPVLIKRGAFIGTRAIILKGVTVGECAIVAAGSVVTCSIPAGEIWGGNPAIFIKNVENIYARNS